MAHALCEFLFGLAVPRWILSAGSKRYDRLIRAFSVIGEMNEVRLARAQKRGAEIAESISGILSALSSPLVEEMPIYASAIRRLANLEVERRQNELAIVKIRETMISARSKEKYSYEIATELRMMEDRAAEESQSLEISGLMMTSRPRQAGDA